MPEAMHRNLLKRYASGGETVRSVRLKPLDNFEKRKLLSEMKYVSQPLFHILNTIELDKSLFKIYQKLLLCLASPSPVCSLIKPVSEVQMLLTAIEKDTNLKEDPVLWTMLHEKIPIIFEILEHSPVTEELKLLLKELWDISITPFVDAVEDISEACPVDMEELSFFPGLPKYRNRGCFDMDKTKQAKKGKDDSCHKKHSGHPSLLPGIFTMYCPHGIILKVLGID